MDLIYFQLLLLSHFYYYYYSKIRICSLFFAILVKEYISILVCLSYKNQYCARHTQF